MAQTKVKSPPRVTTSRIAREAGVSPATVSLVLNRRGDDLRIAPRTQRRVLEAARRLDYVPNYLARGLSGGSTRSIGLLWPLGGAPRNAEIAYQLIQALDRRGHMALLTDALSSPDYTQRSLTELAQRRVDGIIVCAGAPALRSDAVRRAIERFDAAVVIAAEPIDLAADFIWHDRQTVMREVVDHFLNTGRKRPAMLTVADSNPTKVAGFREQLRRRGHSDDDDAIIKTPFSGDRDLIDGAVAHLDRRYGQAFPFDAVACTDDDLAVGLMAWLRQRGLRMPEDVAVTGFNDVRSSRYLSPPLASVDRRDEEVAALAERLIFARLAQPGLPRASHHVAMRFIRRESVGGSLEDSSLSDHTSPSSNRKEP